MPRWIHESVLWEIGGFSFNLDQITMVCEYSSNGYQFLFLAGEGVLCGNGFDATAGAWAFSADGVWGQFAFSNNSVPYTPVSEPGVAFLLGIGLIGLGLSRKVLKVT